LNERLQEKITIHRFRPNIVVKGATPWQEQTFKVIRIGDTVFHGIQNCGRCKMTTIDTASGTFQGPDPLQTLMTFQRKPGLAGATECNAVFGQHLIQENSNHDIGRIISVGNPVAVVEEKPILEHIPLVNKSKA
jgi:uncharacterized protein